MTKKIKYLRRAVEKLVGSELGEKRGREFETLIFDLVEKKVERSEVDLSVEEVYMKTSYEKVGHLFFILGIDRGDGEVVAEEDPEARKKKVRRLKREISDEVEGWDCLVFVDHEARFLRTMEKGVMKPAASHGLYRCKSRKCGSVDFWVWRLQTRSADEPETTFFQCAHCGLRGRHG